jgi:hypothetical protein
VHYVYDTTALANGTATAMINAGGKTWFYLTADYAFGTQLQSAVWDYYKLIRKMSGEDAFGPITGLCPLAPK